MRPGNTDWATNATYVGGPDVGSPTKATPAVGQRAEGRYASQRQAPQIWNWERWEIGVQLAGLRWVRTANWSDPDITGLGAITGGVGDGLYEPTTQTNMVIDSTGVGLAEEVDAPGGTLYAVGVPPAAASAAFGPRCAHNGAGGRGWVQGLTTPPALGPFYSAGWGAWGAWPAGVPAGDWWRIEHDHVGLWAMSDVNGVLSPTSDIAVTTGPAVAWAAPPAAPGFIAGQGAVILRHSHHPAALIYPQDPGNQTWLAISNTEQSTSADGLTWTAAALHFLPAIPVDAAYSAYGARWIVVLIDGRIAVSDDNGASYAILTPTLTALAPTDVRIACDGYGDWAMAFADTVAGSVEVYGSVDNGTTWRQIWIKPDVSGNPPQPAGIKLWYGGGRFHLFTDDGAGVLAAFVSLRGDE